MKNQNTTHKQLKTTKPNGLFQGLLIGVVVSYGCAPLDNYGIRLSLDSKAKLHSRNPFRGAGVKSVISSSKYMLLLGVSPLALKLIHDKTTETYQSTHKFASYIIGSIASTVLTSPLVTLRTRMAATNQPLTTIVRVAKCRNLSTLFAGSPAFIIQDIMAAMLFPIAETITSNHAEKNPKMSKTKTLLTSTAAFTFSGLATLPLMMPFSVIGVRQKIKRDTLLNTLKKTSLRELYAPVPAAIPRMFLSSALVGIVSGTLTTFTQSPEEKKIISSLRV